MPHTGSAGLREKQVIVPTRVPTLSRAPNRNRMFVLAGPRAILPGAVGHSPGDVGRGHPPVTPQRPIDDGSKDVHQALLDGGALEHAKGQGNGFHRCKVFVPACSAQAVVRSLDCRELDRLNAAQLGYATRDAFGLAPGSVGNDQGDACTRVRRPPFVERDRVCGRKEQQRGGGRVPDHRIVGDILAPPQAQLSVQTSDRQLPGIGGLSHLGRVGDQQHPGGNLDGPEQIARAQIRVQPTAPAAQGIDVFSPDSVSHGILGI